MKSSEKVATVLVEEIGNIAEMEAMLELGHRMAKLGVEVYGAIGFGCGGGCDAWGIVCGGVCLQGLPPVDEVMRARFAIDVLGEKGLTSADMDAIRRNFDEVAQITTRKLVSRLSFDYMDGRIARYEGRT